MPMQSWITLDTQSKTAQIETVEKIEKCNLRNEHIEY